MEFLYDLVSHVSSFLRTTSYRMSRFSVQTLVKCPLRDRQTDRLGNAGQKGKYNER